ncbi:hypothetical protein KUL25_20570 [Rhodobacteraceae bacterium N5(2021)]|uniref:Uncharacterized protein n=1 Tax=Gymnodinialimonas phycosphaerae TaxID=2841589 RepID=A0A975TVZ7_9RHOB|nr:hypothetical protein [Gymnodinialimonas phycosphaerae]MBY4895163.1 hypothetical protein [Gymnodinialimonas phycosphaerae]
MSEPGSLRWWQNTALITLAGAALAVWLWDGWPVELVWFPVDTVVLGAPRSEPDLGDYLDAGCLTADNLRAMAEGQPTTIACPVRLVIETEQP